MGKTILLVGAPSYTQVSSSSSLQSAPKTTPISLPDPRPLPNPTETRIPPQFHPNDNHHADGLSTKPTQLNPFASTSDDSAAGTKGVDWRHLPPSPTHLTTNLTQRSWLRTPLRYSLPPGLGSKRRKLGPGHRQRDEDAGRRDDVGGGEGVAYDDDAGEGEEGEEDEGDEDETIELSYLTTTSGRASFGGSFGGSAAGIGTGELAVGKRRRLDHGHAEAEAQFGVKLQEAVGNEEEQEEEEAEDDDDFLEHSFALHNSTMPSASVPSSPHHSPPHTSPPRPPPPTHRPQRPPPPKPPTRPPPPNIIPTPLSNLPTSTTITRAHPGTITTHLLVGLITLHPARRLTVKRTGREVVLIEAVVGDGICSNGGSGNAAGSDGGGFCVSFWLDAPNDSDKPRLQAGQGGLAEDLHDLKIGDILLIQNVALSTFKGKVFGQSLRGNARGRGRTRVWLLWRRGGVRTLGSGIRSGREGGYGREDGGAEDKGPAYESSDLGTSDEEGEEVEESHEDAIRARTKAVREWVVRYIAPPPVAIIRERQAKTYGRVKAVQSRRRGLLPDVEIDMGMEMGLPPDDTQEI